MPMSHSVHDQVDQDVHGTDGIPTWHWARVAPLCSPEVSLESSDGVGEVAIGDGVELPR